MPVTLTIKQVPDALAAKLKARAKGHRRSLQQELLSIMEIAAEGGVDVLATSGVFSRIAEPAAVYATAPAAVRRGKRKTASATPTAGKLTLDQLWQRARKLGGAMPAESAAIVRKDRDARRR